MLSSARPKSKTEVRSLLGLIGFYREFVPNFAAITSPLSDLTKKGQPPVVQWTEAAEKALKTVKERLGTYPILKLPDMSKQFTLRTDASGVGLGAVLLQEYDVLKDWIHKKEKEKEKEKEEKNEKKKNEKNEEKKEKEEEKKKKEEEKKEEEENKKKEKKGKKKKKERRRRRRRRRRKSSKEEERTKSPNLLFFLFRSQGERKSIG
ncbi:hypothetical protein ACOMHN_023610 [Nucella lapillus]